MFKQGIFIVAVLLLFLLSCNQLRAGNSPFERAGVSTSFAHVNTHSLRLSNKLYWKGSATRSAAGKISEARNFKLQTSLASVKKHSSLETILRWDFKLKFRLNKNLNIIFSYN